MTELSKFIKDSSGKIVIGQSPNLSIIMWFGLLVLSIATSDHLAEVSSTLARLFLFVWAYLELTSGVTPLRKTMGLGVIIYILVRSTQ